MLDHREVPNCRKLLDHRLTNKEMLAGVRLKFSDLYREIDESTDPSVALEAFLGGLPAPKKAKERNGDTAQVLQLNTS